MDPRIILETALHREEISAIEALLLLQAGDRLLPELLETADALTHRLHGGSVTYVRSRLIHYTNVCRVECSFCPFWRRKDQRGAFTQKVAEVLRQIRESGPVRQIELQGGLNPDVSLAYLVELVRAVRQEFPRVHIHGFSPSEVHFAARRARTTPYDVLRRLRAAGLGSLSGDSADILNDKVRKKVAGDKLRTNDWVEVIRTAHRLGIPTTATMLFGHIEDEIHIGEHLDIVKNLQKETGGVVAFEPIPFVPANTALSRDRRCRPRNGIDPILKVIAVSRIFFARTIRNIQVDWTKLGLAGTLRALAAGANDLGPLSVDAAEIRTPETNGKTSVPVTVLRGLIQKTGRVPVERDPYSGRVAARPRPRVEEPVLV